MIEAKSTMHTYIGIQEGEEGTFYVNEVDDKKLCKPFLEEE